MRGLGGGLWGGGVGEEVGRRLRGGGVGWGGGRRGWGRGVSVRGGGKGGEGGGEWQGEVRCVDGVWDGLIGTGAGDEMTWSVQWGGGC